MECAGWGINVFSKRGRWRRMRAIFFGGVSSAGGARSGMLDLKEGRFGNRRRLVMDCSGQYVCMQMQARGEEDGSRDQERSRNNYPRVRGREPANILTSHSHLTHTWFLPRQHHTTHSGRTAHGLEAHTPDAPSPSSGAISACQSFQVMFLCHQRHQRCH